MTVKKISMKDVDEAKTALKQAIVSFMRDNELSQHDVAKRCDLPVPYVNQILGDQGKPVSFAKLCEVASRLGLKLSLLIEHK